MNSRTICNIYTKNFDIKVLSILTLLLIYIINNSLNTMKIFFLLFTSILYIIILITIDYRKTSTLHLLLIDSILIYFVMINYIILMFFILNINDIIRISFLIYGLIIMNQTIVIKFSKYTLSPNEYVLGFLITNMLQYIFYQNLKLLLEVSIILLFLVLCYIILFRKKYMNVKYTTLYNVLLVSMMFLMDRSSIIFWCIFILTAITIHIIENLAEESRYSDIKLMLVFLANILMSMLYIISRIDYTYLFIMVLFLVYIDILSKILF